MSNYKVGDKVLVEFEIIERQGHSNKRWNAKSKTDQIYGIDDEDIHSLAPEFKNGEEVEVSLNKRCYSSAIYIGLNRKGKHVVSLGTSMREGQPYIYRHCRKPQVSKPDKFVTDEDGKRYKLVQVV